MDDRLQDMLNGMRKAFKSIPDDAKVEAVSFWLDYARTHEYFTGGDVLLAWRAQQPIVPNAHRNWRNQWAALSSKCGNAWCVKADRVEPTSRQSHTGTLVLWKSMLYTGPKTERMNVLQRIDPILAMLNTGKIGVQDALVRAYMKGAQR